MTYTLFLVDFYDNNSLLIFIIKKFRPLLSSNRSCHYDIATEVAVKITDRAGGTHLAATSETSI